jgi:hypothetical protein
LLLLVIALTGAASPPAIGAPATAPLLASPTELAVAMRSAGQLGVLARRGVPLSTAQWSRALAARARLTAADRARLDDLLALAAPAAQGYLVEAFAAGHDLAELTAFAAVIADRDPYWLRSRLRVVDPTETGAVHFRGNSIKQYNDQTCGATAIMVARAVVDPIYALRLTTGGRPDTEEEEEADERFEDRLAAEEQRIHDDTNRVWPQAAGVTPWAVSNQLSRDLAGLGARYQWTTVALAVSALTDAVLRRALAAVALGYPVPFLIGDLIPRHYVLMLHHDAAGAWVYEPTGGDIVLLPERDLLRRDFSALGFAHLKGAILPAGLTTH